LKEKHSNSILRLAAVLSDVSTEEEFRKPLEAKTIKKSARMKISEL